MKATNWFSKIVILCLLCLGCSSPKNWTIEAYEDDDWTLEIFQEKVLSVLDDPKTEFCFDRNCIPRAVKQAYSQLYGRKFAIANPGEPFNCSCVPNDLPNSRLLFFAKRGADCALVSKRGGRSCNFRATFFKMEDGKLQQLHSIGGANFEKEDVETVKNWLRGLKNDGRGVVGDWRFASN